MRTQVVPLPQDLATRSLNVRSKRIGVFQHAWRCDVPVCFNRCVDDVASTICPARLPGVGPYGRLLYNLMSAVTLHFLLAHFTPLASPIVMVLPIPPPVHVALSTGCLAFAMCAFVATPATWGLLGVGQLLVRPGYGSSSGLKRVYLVKVLSKHRVSHLSSRLGRAICLDHFLTTAASVAVNT